MVTIERKQVSMGREAVFLRALHIGGVSPTAEVQREVAEAFAAPGPLVEDRLIGIARQLGISLEIVERRTTRKVD